jgi:hypothetical protein
MRIATWNLNGKPEDNKARRERLEAEMESELDIDVWVVTEPFPELSITGFARKAHSLPIGSGKLWTEIWVREGKGFLTAEIPGMGPQSTRTACVKLTGTDIGALYIFGTVLPWGSDTGDDPAAPTAIHERSKFCTALEAQRQTWENIRKLDGAPDVGFCLAGDFNKEVFGNKELSNSSTGSDRDHLANVLRQSGLFCLTTGGPGADPAKSPLEIDHICVSNHFRRVAGESRSEMFIPRNCHYKRSSRQWYKAEREPLTDHSGVVATLVRAHTATM